MARQEFYGFTSNREPFFDGTNCSFWSLIMKTYLSALGYDIWQSVEDGYTIPTTHLTNRDAKRESEKKEEDMNTILCGLSKTKFIKVMHCKTTK